MRGEGATCASSTIGVLPMVESRSRIGLADASGHGGQQDDGVLRPDRRLEAVPVADVAVIDIDVDEGRQLTVVGHAVAQRGVGGEQVGKHLGHRRAIGRQAPASPNRLAQDGRDADRAHVSDPSPQAGQAGSRQIFTSLNSVDMASNMSSRPASVSPTPSTSLKTSLAWSMPAIPGSTPRTPATSQAGASSGGGWVGYMQ